MLNPYRFGWKSMAEYAGWSERTMRSLKKDLLAKGVIDYPLKGCPPKRVLRWKPELFDEYRLVLLRNKKLK